MKETIIDETVSKRGVTIDVDAEMERLSKKRFELAERLAKLDTLEQAKNTPYFEKIVLDSYERMQEIERLAIYLPSENENIATMHAELKGRWKERFLLTQELANIRIEKIQKKGFLARVIEKLESLAKKKNKR